MFKKYANEPKTLYNSFTSDVFLVVTRLKIELF